MKKATKQAIPASPDVIDTRQSMLEEIDEAAALLRPHYPGASHKELRARAETMRAARYERGSWPSAEEIAHHREFGSWPSAGEIEHYREFGRWPPRP